MLHGVAKTGALLAAGSWALFGGHVSLGDIAFLLVGTAYVVSLLTGFKPIKALRAEIQELKTEVEERDRKIAERDKTISDLMARVDMLEKSRDVSVALEPLVRAIDQLRSDGAHEHEKIVAALDALTTSAHDGLRDVAKGLAQNTTATATLAAGINAGTASAL